MAHLLKNLFDNDNKELHRYGKIADRIESMEEEMDALSDEELKARHKNSKVTLPQGETLDDHYLKLLLLFVKRQTCIRVVSFPCTVDGGDVTP